ncbi:cytochrome P450 2J4-like [Branchiostoma floridae x Branchiostoma japonicum]
MTIWTGRFPAIVLSGYETIRTALVKRATEDFSSRTCNVGVADVRSEGTTGLGFLMAPCGPRWKQHRKFALMTLRDFGVGKRSLEGKINEEAEALAQEVLSQNGQPFDLQIMMENCVCNIICSIVFGDRFEYGDPEFLRLIHSLNTTIEAKPTAIDTLEVILPVFRHLRLSSETIEAKAVKMFRASQEFCGRQIEKHRLTFDPNDIRDFIDAFLLEQQRAPDEGARANFTDKQLQEILIDLLLAGTETSASAVHWALLYMMLNPEIQEKASFF